MMMSKNFSIFANKSENVKKCYAQKNQNNKSDRFQSDILVCAKISSP